ncbi:MAG: hypothetical protein ACREA0_15485 [bacterium]
MGARSQEDIALGTSFTPEEQRLIALWERHIRCEFTERDAAATVATMSAENYVNHVPVMTEGPGPPGDAGLLWPALPPQDAS